MTMSLEGAARLFAATALSNVAREYPCRSDLTLEGPGDLRLPRAVHPVFYGSYDWHSCVHMHWLLARLLRLYPSIPQGANIRSVFRAHFVPEHVEVEIAFFRGPANRTFERTYGWSWLLKLQTELMQSAATDPAAAAWRDALFPLAELICERYLDFLPLARYPIRAGTHSNSAFGLFFALEYADATQHLALRRQIEATANAWFSLDQRYPARYEPGGDDFLSGGLMEAALMKHLTGERGFVDWWQGFCPMPQDLQTWLIPVDVADRADPKLAHLDGLNLSRAWCWKLLLPQLPPALHASVADSIDAHLGASLLHTTTGSYSGTHWLASFALLALS